MMIRLFYFLGLGSVVWAGDFATRCAERTAIERVYHTHRLGPKAPFEETLPPAALESLVRLDLRKEAALKKAYGVEITPTMLAAEVRRINTTTRAPEMLAEIKAALGNDPAHFARAMARPILVERLLREQFDNDDALHAPERQQAERAREALLVARKSGAPSDALVALLKRSHSNAVTETTWQLGARPADTKAIAADELEIKKRFGANAQLLSSPTIDGKETKFYFVDLPGELQNVLRVQLRQTGDLSAVIETPRGFLLYVAKERTDFVLSVAGLSLPKRSYEEWLEAQPHNRP